MNIQNGKSALPRKIWVGVLVVILLAALLPMASFGADKVEGFYHYVGREVESSPEDYITLFNSNPNTDVTVRIKVTDHRGLSRYRFDVPSGSHLVLRTSDLGITDLYYLRISSNNHIAVSIYEAMVQTGIHEWGGVTPQARLFTSYALANATGNPADDSFRIYAPVTPFTIEFYDQNLNLLATRTIDGNGLAEFNAGELGYPFGWSAYFKAADETPYPFAISFLEGPQQAFLIIPQGIPEGVR